MLPHQVYRGQTRTFVSDINPLGTANTTIDSITYEPINPIDGTVLPTGLAQHLVFATSSRNRVTDTMNPFPTLPTTNFNPDQHHQQMLNLQESQFEESFMATPQIIVEKQQQSIKAQLVLQAKMQQFLEFIQ